MYKAICTALVAGALILGGCKSKPKDDASASSTASTDSTIGAPPPPPPPVSSPTSSSTTTDIKPIPTKSAPPPAPVVTSPPPAPAPVPAPAPKAEHAKPDHAKPADHAGARPKTYVVQKGDTLSGIAKKFYGEVKKVNDIAAANKLKDPNHIRVGQTLTLP